MKNCFHASLSADLNSAPSPEQTSTPAAVFHIFSLLKAAAAIALLFGFKRSMCLSVCYRIFFVFERAKPLPQKEVNEHCIAPAA
jgi:hypothetical protein